MSAHHQPIDFFTVVLHFQAKNFELPLSCGLPHFRYNSHASDLSISLYQKSSFTSLLSKIHPNPTRKNISETEPFPFHCHVCLSLLQNKSICLTFINQLHSTQFRHISFRFVGLSHYGVNVSVGRLHLLQLFIFSVNFLVVETIFLLLLISFHLI